MISTTSRVVSECYDTTLSEWLRPKENNKREFKRLIDSPTKWSMQACHVCSSPSQSWGSQYRNCVWVLFPATCRKQLGGGGRKEQKWSSCELKIWTCISIFRIFFKPQFNLFVCLFFEGGAGISVYMILPPKTSGKAWTWGWLRKTNLTKKEKKSISTKCSVH